MRKIIVIFLFIISFTAEGQKVLFRDSLCLGEATTFSTDLHYESYEWDFCPPMFDDPADVKYLGEMADANRPLGIDFIKVDGVWHGIATNWGSHKLSRLTFGNGLDEFPSSIDDLGNPENLLNQPVSIGLVEQNDTIYALVHNWANKTLIRIRFDEGITGNILTPDVIATSYGEMHSKMDVIQTQSELKAIVVNQNSSMQIVDFRGDIRSELKEENRLTTTPIPGINGVRSIQMICDSLNWYAFMASSSTGMIVRADFGQDIMTGVKGTEIVVGSNIFDGRRPYNLRMMREGGVYQIHVNTLQGALYKIDLGLSIKNAGISSAIQYGTQYAYNEGYALAFIEDSSRWHGFIVNDLNRKLYSISFEKDCSASVLYSTATAPSVSFSAPGLHIIELKTVNETGGEDYLVDTIYVKNSDSPQGEIAIDDAHCVTMPIKFGLNTEDDIVSYHWSFADAGTSVLADPQFKFAETGAKIIALDILNAQGCANTLEKTIHVFNPPIASFISVDTACSGSVIEFDNSTIMDESSPVIWRWNFSESDSATQESPEFIFNSSGTKKALLLAEMSGCSSFFEKDIIVLDGPQVDYAMPQFTCVEKTINFENQTTGEEILTYEWRIGESLVSTGPELSFSFDTAGLYSVMLSALDNKGCAGSKSSNIDIYDQIISDIIIEEAVENLSFQTAATFLEGHPFQISEFQWKVNDQESHLSKPSFAIGLPGEYPLSVIVNTNDGCTFEWITEITVAESEWPTADFPLPDSVCIGEVFAIENKSVNAVSYEWDFCPPAFEDSATVSVIGELTGSDRPLGIELIEVNGTWYGIAVNYGNHKIFRMEFENGLDKEPTSITDLGNPDGLLNQPASIGMVVQNDSIYALIHNWANKTLVRIRFDNGLPNNQLSAVVVASSYGSLLSKMEIVKTHDELKAIVVNQNSTMQIVDFENDINKTVTEANRMTTPTITGMNNVRSIQFINESGEWHAFLGSYLGTIVRVDFGSDIMTGMKSTETVVKENIFNGAYLQNFKIFKEADNYQLHALMANGQLYKTSIGEDIKNTDISEAVRYGESFTYPEGYALDFIEFNSRWQGIVLNDMTRMMYAIKFEKECAASLSFSSLKHPSVSFSKPGDYIIELKARHANGRMATIVKILKVSNKLSESLTIENSDHYCQSSPVEFKINNKEWVLYNWSLGDGSTSELPEPVRQFQDTGVYGISLEVFSSNGCRQRATKEISIYEEPLPSFTIPSGTLCSHSEIPFANTSKTFGADSVIQWSWDLNEEGASADKNPSFTFPEGGVKSVSLTASIPGCAPRTVKSFDVTAGPEVDFAIANQCFGEELHYSNLSSGDGITGYFWDLGDGRTSFEKNPSTKYDSAGNYPARLETTNDKGCSNAKEKIVTVHHLPVASFDYGLACSSGTQFEDKSAVQRANLASWRWSLMKDDVFEPISNEKNPLIATETPGIHKVRLTVGSNYGCSDSAEAVIEALPGPSADFTHKPICLGDSVQFLDLSASLPENPVGKWFWTINGEGFARQNPKYLFKKEGSYEVSLKVDAQNRCSDMTSAFVKVPALPVPAFATSNLCENEQIAFTDHSVSPDDPVRAWRWRFGETIFRNGEETSYQFPQAGDYTVMLDVETENGCKQSITKTIGIHKAPKAKFTLYPAIGIAPQPVVVANQSTGASSYIWDFEARPASVFHDFEPEYIYESLGDRLVSLVAIDEKGCMDTVTAPVSIRLPALDIEVQHVLKMVDRGELQLVARITD